MTTGSPYKVILFFSIPLLIGNLFQQLYSMVDTIIIGRLIGVNELAAVGATGALNYLVIGFATGMTGGFAVVTAQKYGAGDKEGVKKTIGTSVILCLIISILLTSLSLGGTKGFLKMMNMPEDLFGIAYEYIGVIFAGIGATIYYNMIAGILRALGDSKTPLMCLVFSSVLNIILDLVFIINFNMGVMGAALATVLAQLIGAAVCNVYAVRKYELLRLSKQDFACCREDSKWHLRLGLPMALQCSITALGMVILQGALNIYGAGIMAAYAAASKVEALVTQPLYALGLTMETYCGQNIGAGRMDRVKKGFSSVLVLGMCATVIAAMINILGGESMVKLFMEDTTSEVLKYAKDYLVLIAIFYPALCSLFIFRSGLQGMGEAIVPMIGGIAELVARTVACVFLPAFFGYMGVYFATPLAWLCALIPLITRYIIKSRQETCGIDQIHDHLDVI